MTARLATTVFADAIAASDAMRAVQEMVDRCPTPEDKKHFIVAAGAAGAITREEATLLIQAYQLETA